MSDFNIVLGSPFYYNNRKQSEVDNIYNWFIHIMKFKDSRNLSSKRFLILTVQF